MAISEIATVTQLLSGAIELAKRYKDSELSGALVNIHGVVFGLMEERQELKEALKKAKDTRSLAKRRKFEHNSYWLPSDGGPEGPYCSRCWDVEDKSVRMHDRDGGYFHCPGCKTGVEVGQPQGLYAPLP